MTRATLIINYPETTSAHAHSWIHHNTGKATVCRLSLAINFLIIYPQKNQLMLYTLDNNAVYDYTTKKTGEQKQPDTPFFQHHRLPVLTSKQTFQD
ncbi:hypothetical protein EW514_08455 [Salmonella enterica subsp. enterica serovar Napoli]|nr:hypothetical protein [Salmonella enterica subsp. enterica serovar Napoli]